MENVITIFFLKISTRAQAQLCRRCTHTHTHTHTLTHTHTVQTDRSEGQCGLTEIFWKDKCLELAFEGRESSRVPDVLGEIVPDVGARVWESAKAMGFAVKALDFEHACVWWRVERAGRTVKTQLKNTRGSGSCITWFSDWHLSHAVRCHQGTQGGTHSVMGHLIQWLTPVMCCLSGVARGHRVGCVQFGLPRGRTHQNCECIQYCCCVVSITRVWSFMFVSREVNVGLVFSVIVLHQLWDILTDEWGFNSGCIHLKSSQRLYLRK